MEPYFKVVICLCAICTLPRLILNYITTYYKTQHCTQLTFIFKLFTRINLTLVTLPDLWNAPSFDPVMLKTIFPFPSDHYVVFSKMLVADMMSWFFLIYIYLIIFELTHLLTHIYAIDDFYWWFAPKQKENRLTRIRKNTLITHNRRDFFFNSQLTIYVYIGTRRAFIYGCTWKPILFN